VGIPTPPTRGRRSAIDSDPRNAFERETDRDFDDIERITRTFVRYAKAFLCALPLWLVLLVLFPYYGLGESSSFLGASIIASGVAIGGQRMFRRRNSAASAPGASRRRINPPGRVTLVVLTAAIVLYLVLVLRAGG
jgi:hypothetical protein